MQHRVFQIGFNRCATMSIAEMFAQAGVPTIHWNDGKLAMRIKNNATHYRKLIRGLEKYHVFSDMELNAEGIYCAEEYFKQFDEQYEEAKFILNTRNRENWIRSRLKHTSEHGSYLKNYMQANRIPTKEKAIEDWKRRWDNHHEAVLKHFTSRPNDLLVFDIEEDEDRKILAFASKVFPAQEFANRLPHLNRSPADHPAASTVS